MELDWSEESRQTIERLVSERAPHPDPAVDAYARQIGALPVVCDFFSTWFLQPDGTVVVAEVERLPVVPSEVTRDRGTVLAALVQASKRHPALKAFFPQRPTGANECACWKIELFHSRKLVCDRCGGLGWLPPGNA